MHIKLIIQQLEVHLLDVFLRFRGNITFLLFTASMFQYSFRHRALKMLLIRRKAFGVIFAGFLTIHFSLIGVKSFGNGDSFTPTPEGIIIQLPTMII